MLITFKRCEFCAMQVFGDLPKARFFVSFVMENETLDLRLMSALSRA
jgi:hypothetical protein